MAAKGAGVFSPRSYTCGIQDSSFPPLPHPAPQPLTPSLQKDGTRTFNLLPRQGPQGRPCSLKIPLVSTATSCREEEGRASPSDLCRPTTHTLAPKVSTFTYFMSLHQTVMEEKQTPPQNTSGPNRCFFIGYLPGIRRSTETSRLRFLPSKKLQTLGSEISQTWLGLTPYCSNQCTCDLGQMTLVPEPQFLHL